MNIAFSHFSAQEPYDGNHSILILHGLFGSQRNWYSIAKRLAEKFEVYTLDLRNHGESAHSEIMSYQEMAGDILQFVSEHDLNKVAIVGHSIGGKVAMQASLQEPEMISKLIIVDIAPVQYEHNFYHLVDLLNTLPLERIDSRQQADEYLQFVVKPKALRQFLLQNLRSSNDGFFWRINLHAIQSCIEAIEGFPDGHDKPYRNPVLFLKGERSNYIRDAYDEEIFRLFPGALFITVPDAGHWLQAENPDFVIKEIAEFMQ